MDDSQFDPNELAENLHLARLFRRITDADDRRRLIALAEELAAKNKVPSVPEQSLGRSGALPNPRSSSKR